MEPLSLRVHSLAYWFESQLANGMDREFHLHMDSLELALPHQIGHALRVEAFDLKC